MKKEKKKGRDGEKDARKRKSKRRVNDAQEKKIKIEKNSRRRRRVRGERVETAAVCGAGAVPVARTHCGGVAERRERRDVRVVEKGVR